MQGSLERRHSKPRASEPLDVETADKALKAVASTQVIPTSLFVTSLSWPFWATEPGLYPGSTPDPEPREWPLLRLIRPSGLSA